MIVEVKIPMMGESISSGVLATWHAPDGGRVSAGQLLLELETDKITQELHAESGGTLRHRVAEGTEVAVGSVVAMIESGEAAAEGTSGRTSADSGSTSAAPSGSAGISSTFSSMAASTLASPQPASVPSSAAPSGGQGTLDIKIPSMGESISSGILNWRVADGAVVKEGQILAELETDKITQDLAAEAAGVISLRAADASEVSIGEVVAVIQRGGAAAVASLASEKSAPAVAKAVPAVAPGAVASHAPADGVPFPMSPAVRRVAAETGIDPKSVAGTGKDGRVTKGDLLSAVEAAVGAVSRDLEAAERLAASKRMDPEQAAASRPPFSRTPTASAASDGQAGAAALGHGGPRTSRKKMSPLRRKIAERLVQATTEAALLTTFNEVDMSAVMELRKRYQEDFVAKHGVKLGFMSFFVKATVEALKAVPGINAQLDGDEVVTNHYYDIGVAVGTDKGLIVPVIRDCDRRGFAEIESEIIAKAKVARAGKLTLDDLQGGVFTISNGGIYGSMLSTPLLNMPQSGILGLHNITDRPMAVNGQVVIRPMMYLALSYDHRLVDGKEAVTFLVKIKQLIEAPDRLLFGL